MTTLDAPGNRPNDMLILVDGEDRELGFRSKEECHRGDGLLHRAFSVFVFNRRGELLLQQRSAAKPLWPQHWSNSCCSHPRRGESAEAAAERRLREELALHCELEFLYKFQYQARFGDVGAEHELCWVFAGFSDDAPRPDPEEIAAVRYLPAEKLTVEISRTPALFTPWLRLEWVEISAHHLARVRARAMTAPRAAAQGR